MFGECVVSGEACFHVSVLDTTFFIDLFRQDSGAALLWESMRREGAPGSYSAITAFELWLGQLSQQESDFYDSLLISLNEISLTASAARQAADLLRDMSPSASERLIRDAMMAASAAEQGEKVVTSNVRDFTRLSASVETY